MRRTNENEVGLPNGVGSIIRHANASLLIESKAVPRVAEFASKCLSLCMTCIFFQYHFIVAVATRKFDLLYEFVFTCSDKTNPVET